MARISFHEFKGAVNSCFWWHLKVGMLSFVCPSCETVDELWKGSLSQSCIDIREINTFKIYCLNSFHLSKNQYLKRNKLKKVQLFFAPRQMEQTFWCPWLGQPVQILMLTTRPGVQQCQPQGWLDGSRVSFLVPGYSPSKS